MKDSILNGPSGIQGGGIPSGFVRTKHQGLQPIGSGYDLSGQETNMIERTSESLSYSLGKCHDQIKGLLDEVIKLEKNLKVVLYQPERQAPEDNEKLPKITPLVDSAESLASKINTARLLLQNIGSKLRL